MHIVFGRTRHYYHSYADFWHLVEVSGFDVRPLDSIDFDDPERIVITTPINGDFPQERARSRKSKIVLWELERPDVRKITPFLDHHFNAFFDEVWVSDRHYASMDPRARFVPMSSDKRLRLDPSDTNKVYDFAHLMYVYGRRDEPMSKLRATKLREAPLANFGPIRDLTLRQSHMMVNVHQTPVMTGEPLRVAIAAAYSLPYLTETIIDPFPMAVSEHFEPTTLDDFVDAVQRTRRRPDLTELGKRLHSLMCEQYTFERCVREAVETIR